MVTVLVSGLKASVSSLIICATYEEKPSNIPKIGLLTSVAVRPNVVIALA